MAEKVFKTLDEQIAILESRGITITSEDERTYARNVLEKNGYYNLVNGYNKLFLDPQDPSRYRPGSTMREMHALFQFDRILRNIFFRYILEAETNIKSLISYYFAEAHGHKNYLIYTNFNSNLKDSDNKITSLIAEIQGTISNRCSDPSIRHYLNQHGYIPLWVLNNILSFGVISKFYSLMLPAERQKISKRFSIMDNELENALFYISKVRNFCAHGNRLYCYRTKTPLLDTKYHSSMKINKPTNNEYAYGKRDLFACMIALKFILSRSEFLKMNQEIFDAIGILDKKLSLLKRSDILEEMGFPSNWGDLRYK